MAAQADVRRIALSMPGAEEADGRFAFSVTEPHYNGFPAVLVRLDAVSVADLKVLIAEAWRCQAPVERTKRAKSR